MEPDLLEEEVANTIKITLIWIVPLAGFLLFTFDILITTITKPTGNRDTAAEL